MYLKDLNKTSDVISKDINISKGKLLETRTEELILKYKDYKILQYYNLNEYKKPVR